MPSASWYRWIMPSSMLAAPRMVPDFMQSMVLVPMTCRAGLSRLMWGSWPVSLIPMSRTTNKTRALVQLSLLIALEAVMAFTPLGFIMIPPISITILHIPVIIFFVLAVQRQQPVQHQAVIPEDGGAAVGDDGGGQPFFASSPADLLFSPFHSGQPVQSLVMCVLPRILLKMDLT